MQLPRSTMWLELAIPLIFHGLPSRLRRVLAGNPIRIDGQTLDPDLQLLLRLERMTSAGTPAASLARRREHLDVASGIVGGRSLRQVHVRDLRIPAGSSGEPDIPARLYTPDNLPAGSPLLVYNHGGGWVTGSLNSHDALCRLIALRSGVRLLSIDYRLAPEHPFPAALTDVLTAWRFARAHAGELGADAGSIALGGDSAGANLAAAAAHCVVRSGSVGPDFLLLFYPPADAVHSSRSRELFGSGFLLTEQDIAWFCDHYMPPPIDRADPRASILLADDLTGMPPTYLVTAGFDPIRDEGEAYAQRLAAAGVPVVTVRQPDLIHGFVNMIGLTARCREAVIEAAGALRAGLAMASSGAPGQTRTDTVRDLNPLP
ncbi:MAG: alpha/beta hydrolase, partial [Nakamurella sp.]